MARKKAAKRKAPAAATSNSSPNKDEEAMWNSKTKKKKQGSSGAVEMFEELTADDPESTSISIEEIATLGEKLGMADVTEDVRILVLLWKFKCKKPGCMSKEEWIEGCESLNVDSFESLKKLLPSLDPGFFELADYKSFYKFCFQFNRQGTHKSLDKDVVISLLQIVLKDSTNIVPAERLSSFCDFLGQHELDKITSDQWVSFLDFCIEVKDLADYEDSTSAWPVLLDEYVEFLEKLLSK